MVDAGRRWQLRRWGWGFAALLAWMAVSLGWSWLLIQRSFGNELESRMVARATRLAELAREHMHPVGGGGVVDWDQADLQAEAEGMKRADSVLAYVMVWTEDGKVLAHSRRDLRLTRLNSSLWPELDGKQTYRVSKLVLPDVSREARVVEATVPLRIGGGGGALDKTVAYASAAYSQDWVDEEFWRSEEPVLLLACGITVGGLIAIFLGIHFAIGRADRHKREVLQTARARTSLLTERGMLASVLAHEVRSPLTALRFNLHSLRTLVGGRSSDVDRQVELTDRCEREIRRLDGMLNDFLQRTQVIGPVESSSVNTVISEALEFLRPALERKNIRTSIHLDPSDPLVHVHPDELRQVLLNLATNAHEAMPKGGTLAVSTVAEDITQEGGGQEGTVTILIRDSGTGIPPELHERIFEPFFSTKPQGSGLGLALVRRVVSGAGGTVFCESVVGARGGGGETGTTFRIVLPRAQANEAGAGRGYAHVRREESALEIDETPEFVIDKQDEKPEASSQKPEG